MIMPKGAQDIVAVRRTFKSFVLGCVCVCLLSFATQIQKCVS